MPTSKERAETEDRARRMKWWHEARFGMFVHWGLYSVLGRHEWAMECEAIPFSEYSRLARRFRPKRNCAEEWAKLAARAGMKYMVMTTKHHEGYCLFDTKLTNYCAPRLGCGRDLVAEYVAAARRHGLRVGFYYSLMDWKHPDGALCERDEQARRRFVDYIHGQIRELCTNYGKIDILWYDVPWPLDAAGWESEKMNKMVFRLQPDIIVNNRNRLSGDFGTPEQEIRPPERKDRAWEACMTINESWGYHRSDDNWKSAKQIVRNLVKCSNRGANYLLNIGPRADGSVPAPSVRVLEQVGDWLRRHGHTIYGSEHCDVTTSLFGGFTRKGRTLYAHVHFWPGESWAIGGLKTRVKSVRLLGSGRRVRFEQDEFRLRLSGLPARAPDPLVSVLELRCASDPVQDLIMVRRCRERSGI